MSSFSKINIILHYLCKFLFTFLTNYLSSLERVEIKSREISLLTDCLSSCTICVIHYCINMRKLCTKGLDVALVLR